MKNYREETGDSSGHLQGLNLFPDKVGAVDGSTYVLRVGQVAVPSEGGAEATAKVGLAERGVAREMEELLVDLEDLGTERVGYCGWSSGRDDGGERHHLKLCLWDVSTLFALVYGV